MVHFGTEPMYILLSVLTKLEQKCATMLREFHICVTPCVLRGMHQAITGVP